MLSNDVSGEEKIVGNHSGIRFGLKTMLVSVVLVSLVLANIALRTKVEELELPPTGFLVLPTVDAGRVEYRIEFEAHSLTTSPDSMLPDLVRWMNNNTEYCVLDLSDSDAADGGVTHLREVKHLKKLYLQRTKVTPESVNRLRAALPGCTVYYP